MNMQSLKAWAIVVSMMASVIPFAGAIVYATELRISASSASTIAQLNPEWEGIRPKDFIMVEGRPLKVLGASTSGGALPLMLVTQRKAGSAFYGPNREFHEIASLKRKGAVLVRQDDQNYPSIQSLFQ